MREQGAAFASVEFQTDALDIQPGLFMAFQALDVHIERIVGKCTQIDIGIYTVESEVGEIEKPFCTRLEMLVETERRAAHDKGIDAQIEWGVTSGVFRSQTIEHELEIGFRVLCVLIEREVGAKKLCRVNRYLAVY